MITNLCTISFLLLASTALGNHGLGRHHIILKHLLKLHTLVRIYALHDKLLGEDVREFGAVSVAAAGGFLFVVVKV